MSDSLDSGKKRIRLIPARYCIGQKDRAVLSLSSDFDVTVAAERVVEIPKKALMPQRLSVASRVNLLLVTALTGFIFIEQSAADPYYRSDGRSTPSIIQGDPRNEQVDEWEIWLYPSGVPTGAAASRWGLITGKTVDSVTRQLKLNQDFERRFNRFFHTRDDRFTFENYLGPIAIIRRESSPSGGFLDGAKKLQELASQASEIFGSYNNAASILGDEIEKENPTSRSAAQEFLKNLHEAMERTAKLRESLQTWGDTMLPQLDREFDAITRELNSAQAQIDLWKTGQAGNGAASTDTALETARTRLRDLLKNSAETSYSDRSLDFSDASHYRQFATVIDRSEKEFSIELPPGSDITLFAASSRNTSGFSSISVEEESAIPRYLGSCSTSCSSVKLRSIDVTRKVKVKISFSWLPYDRDQGNKVYILFYAHAQ